MLTFFSIPMTFHEFSSDVKGPYYSVRGNILIINDMCFGRDQKIQSIHEL